MGLLSRFEGKMEDTVEGAAERMGGSSLSPVQIAKKAEKQMRREKMVGAGKQYAPTLYTVLVSPDDDARLFGYYPTLAGETETYLTAKANEHGLVMDGQPLVRFIADEGLRRGKFEVIAELVAGALVRQLRQEEMERYGLATPKPQRPARAARAAGNAAAAAGAGSFAAAAAAHAAPAANPNLIPLQSPGLDPSFDDIDDPMPAAHSRAAAPAASAARTAIAPAVGAAASSGGILVDAVGGQTYTLTGAPQRLGRESTCELVVPDINASRTHAEVRRDPSGAWIVSDLGSTNGTFLNGRQVKSAPLHPGDVVTIGTTELEFRPA